MPESKCEACGRIGGKDYVYVRTLNGGLNLCTQCLASINGKNPELLALRPITAALLAKLEEAVTYVAMGVADSTKTTRGGRDKVGKLFTEIKALIATAKGTY